MEQYEFTIVRYDHRGLMADTVVAAGRHEIQDLLDDGWNVFLVKPVELAQDTNYLILYLYMNVVFRQNETFPVFPRSSLMQKKTFINRDRGGQVS